MEHCKISNPKHQIPMKSQISIFNDQNRFGILKLGTRPQGGESKRSADNFGHCDLFVICNLLFGIFTHSSTSYSNSALARLTGRASFALLKLAFNWTLLVASVCPAEQAICPTYHRTLYKQAIDF